MIRIVDASAVGAVLFVERDADWVNEQTVGMDLVAPGLLSFEIGNICWKRMQRAESDFDSLMVIWMAWNTSSPVRFIQPDPVQTLRLAHETGLTFYDASYVRLAQEHAAELISLDAKLVRVARRLGLEAPSPHIAPRSRN